MNFRSLCSHLPTLHHCPYPSFISLNRWFWVIVYSIISWLVNHHVSWPLSVYRVVTIVWFAPQLCNLRTLLHPSQSSALLRTSQLSILRAPSIWFALLHSCLSLKSSICYGSSPGLKRISLQERITTVNTPEALLQMRDWREVLGACLLRMPWT